MLLSHPVYGVGRESEGLLAATPKQLFSWVTAVAPQPPLRPREVWIAASAGLSI